MHKKETESIIKNRSNKYYTYMHVCVCSYILWAIGYRSSYKNIQFLEEEYIRQNDKNKSRRKPKTFYLIFYFDKR